MFGTTLAALAAALTQAGKVCRGPALE